MKTLKLTIALIMLCCASVWAQALSSGSHSWTDGSSTINFFIVSGDPQPYDLGGNTYNGSPLYFVSYDGTMGAMIYALNPFPFWPGTFRVYFNIAKDSSNNFYCPALFYDDVPSPLWTSNN